MEENKVTFSSSWERGLGVINRFLQILEREGEENEALHKMMASEQKTSLQNLFHDKCRPCLGSWPQVGKEGGRGMQPGSGEVFMGFNPSPA